MRANTESIDTETDSAFWRNEVEEDHLKLKFQDRFCEFFRQKISNPNYYKNGKLMRDNIKVLRKELLSLEQRLNERLYHSETGL